MKKLSAMLAIVLLLGLFGGANFAFGQTITVTMLYEANPHVVVNGQVGVGEYKASYHETTTNMTISWEHNGTVMYIALQSQGTGWVAIAFGVSGTGMDGANILIGTVVDASGSVVMEDDFGVVLTHPSDVSRGGVDNIIAKAGTQSAGKTTLEFVFPLATTDPNDYNLAMGGTYGFFVAFHQSSDDLTLYHTKHSATMDVVMESPLPLPKSDFTYAVSGLTVTLTQNSSAQSGSITSWTWKFGDNTSSTQQNPVHTYAAMNDYAVSLTVTDSQGRNATKTTVITVPSKPERLSIWTNQVILVTIIIALASFFAVGIAATRRQKGEKTP